MNSAVPAGAAGATPRLETVWRRYAEHLRRPPLLTIEWADSQTPARGWLVINSLRGGAAGGGTRMRPGLTRREVTYLAKTMEVKFAFSGPPIGGAKSGLDFDPADPGRAGVLRRWFQAISPQLQRYYGTGGDLNVDELQDVIPACAAAGVEHPQEGVVRGHLRPDEPGFRRILATLDAGLKAPVDPVLGIADLRLPVADLVTGYGVARALIRLYEAQGRAIRGSRVIVEGFGSVGGPCALYLAREGASIVGIADRDKALLEPAGLTADEVEELLRRRDAKLLPADDARCRRGAERERFWHTGAEVFVAAASSATIDADVLGRLRDQGVRTITCGANQPFREAKLGATRVQRAADRHFTVIPDVVANCGMARAFSYLMGEARGIDTAALFGAVDQTITSALREISELNRHRSTGVLGATLAYALDHLTTT